MALKERPILFSDAMVRAILSGAKTQTRRPVKLHFAADSIATVGAVMGPDGEFHESVDGCPIFLARLGGRSAVVRRPARVGDRLWVRECFALSVRDPEDAERSTIDPSYWDPPVYRADYQPGGGWTDGEGNAIPPPWHPSIHMPRWASRLTLRVTDVRVERVQDISEEDARAEGIAPKSRAGGAMIFDGSPPDPSYVVGFRETYCDAYGNTAWDANPWVWVVGFEVER